MDETRQVVRERYGTIAIRAGSCCAPDCCGSEELRTDTGGSQRFGYGEAELASLPDGAHLGLGCGSPQALAALQDGEVVLDLGSGGGVDCFLAAQRVGRSGRVIGVDMTAEMVTLARRNQSTVDARNVDFRLGEIEHLPVADGEVDVIISNCVINLSPDKPAVFREAMRVLKPGGRLAISDVVATAALPDDVRADLGAVAACVGGAASVSETSEMLAEAGFVDVRVMPLGASQEIVSAWDAGRGLHEYIASATIEGRKPR